MTALIFKKDGFSFTELIIVISIIGIFLIVMYTVGFGLFEQGKDARIREDLNTIYAALQQYYFDTNTYPDADSFEDLLSILMPDYLGNEPNQGKFYFETSNLPQLTPFMLYAELSDGTYIYRGESGIEELDISPTP